MRRAQKERRRRLKESSLSLARSPGRLAYALLLGAVLLTGCHTRMRVASPQITRAPDVCVVVVQADAKNDGADLAAAAIKACKAAEQ
jgi:hypothetical protein